MTTTTCSQDSVTSQTSLNAVRLEVSFLENLFLSVEADKDFDYEHSHVLDNMVISIMVDQLSALFENTRGRLSRLRHSGTLTASQPETMFVTVFVSHLT